MTLTEGATMVALDAIALPDNVRALDAAHVESLAESIALRGLIVPLVVRSAADHGDRFVLVGPLETLEREHRGALRGFAEQARPANLALGDALLKHGALADPADLDVARVFVYGLLGARSHFRDDGRVAQGYDLKRAGQLAVHGLRLCIGELSSAETATRADGTAGRTRVEYAAPGDAEAWMWRFVDGASNAAELYGRALVVLWAADCALQEVLPRGDQQPTLVACALEERALTALRKLGRRHVPVALRRLEKAIAAHADEYRERKDALEHDAARARAARLAGSDDGDAGAADDVEGRGPNPSHDGDAAQPAPEGSRIAA
jgi:hypothetical protein